uniref:WD_REPEATS_REGION domain-containing protein n=1 Tax=Caenorhabditis tropicalis TaxID=1561998 RepID=A0A1I7U6K6_9PELO
MTNNQSIMNKPLPSTGSNFTKLSNTYPTLAPRTLESEIGGISARRPSQAPGFTSPMTNRSHSTEEETTFATPTLPRRFTNSGATGFPKKLMISPAKSRQRPQTPGDNARPLMDLNNIVTNYFRSQHAACKNPVTTCPPFSLFHPHKCPERIQKTPVMRNIVNRLLNQELLRPHERIVSGWRNEKLIFSKFKNVKTIQDSDESYVSAIYSVDDEHLIVGHFNGELHWINADTGLDESHTNCHGSAIVNIDASRDGSMILTSSAYSRPLSGLWRLGQNMERIHMYREETCMRFANTTIGKIIGTSRNTVTVYDTETNHVLDTYKTGIYGLEYEKNYASFSPDDKLIFSDGLLWDVRNRNAPIHTFDRLAAKTNFGIFHPHGNQIIIDSDVYDIRTFRMLHHVPELSQSKLIFNSSGNIMIANKTSDLQRPETTEDLINASLRTFDTLDYSVLTTLERRRPAIDIALSHHDQKLAIIEKTRPMLSEFMIQSSTQIRMLETGRLKEAEDEAEEEEDEARDDHGAGDDSDDSGDEDDVEDNAQENESVFDALGRVSWFLKGDLDKDLILFGLRIWGRKGDLDKNSDLEMSLRTCPIKKE